MQNIPRPCSASRCPHCGAPDRVRAITTASLEWYFGEGEAAVSAPSSQSAFEHMLTVGPPQHGGRSNGVEDRAVDQHRLDATARHRCLRTRLAEVAPSDLEILRTAYGPTDWTRSIREPQARAAIARATSLFEVAAVRAMPLTPKARETAARRQASPPPAKPRKSRPSSPGRPSAAEQHEKLRDWLAAQPGLAASPQGVVLGVLVAGGPALRDLVAEARELVRAAREAAGVVEPQASRRVRSVQLVPKPKALAEPEYLGRQHAEVLAGG